MTHITRRIFDKMNEIRNSKEITDINKLILINELQLILQLSIQSELRFNKFMSHYYPNGKLIEQPK